MPPNGLFLDGVAISLAGKPLLALTQRVVPGEVLTVMGPSGSGKSTLLAFIGGFLDPAFAAGGRVFAGDTELTRLAPQDRHAGVLFQDPLLFPHMSVLGNLVFAIGASVKERSARRALAEQALRDVDLDGLGRRDPDTLSGGQMARVALARAMLSSPRLLLLDEPFSKLDMELRQQMREMTFSKARAAGLPVVLVTHDEADAAAAGGAVVRLGVPR